MTMTKAKKKTKTTSRADKIHLMRAAHSDASRAPKVVPVVRDKRKLDVLLKRLAKKYDDPVFATIANGSRSASVKALPSGWQEVDDLVTGDTDADCRSVPGTGLGWPRGRIVEVYGAEGSGKTTLTLHIIAAFQAAGERCAFVDAEHALDVSYAKKLGVRLDELMLNQPEQGGEQALDVVMACCESGAFSVVVVDSVAALTPQAELEMDFEDNSQPGAHARLMSRALRKLTAVVAKNGVLLVFINQTRMKFVRFGNPWTTTGGQPLKFYSSIRLELTTVKTTKKGDTVIFRRTRMKTVKNKVASPFREVYLDLAPGKGIVAVHGDPDFGGGGSDDE